MRGVFVTLEGGEGVGKSTQARLLSARLTDAGIAHLPLREPGGTPVADAVRSVLLDPEHAAVDPWAELFLYEASRAQLVSERIAPALEEGVVVVCDRFTDSTTAYQSFGRGLDRDVVDDLNRLASRGLVPDLTLLLDLDPSVGIARATASFADRLEREEAVFHERVRAGFRDIAAAEPDRVRVVDASADVASVAAEVWSHVGALLSACGVLHSQTP